MERATEVLDKHDADAQEAGLDVHYVFSPTQRALVHLAAGEYEEALAQAGEATARGKSTGLEGAAELALRRNVELISAIAEARLGRVEAAEARIPFLEQEMEKAPQMVNAVQIARGVVAMAKGENESAVGAFSKCEPRAALCAWQLAEARDLAGDAEGADAAWAHLRELRLRDGFYLVLWAKAGAHATPPDPAALVSE